MTALSHAEKMGRYLGAFVDELVAWGLRDLCLCPGSRSTPLALAFARHPAVKLWMHLDERSCAYFAMGLAKVQGGERPVAILCSSGTAAVNFGPAVVEAYHSRVPLLVLTADRPPELQELGSNQTIDQVRLYGPAVKWFVQMPLPDAAEGMLRYVRMVASRAVSTACHQGADGPVHLNFPFREPLVPAPYEPRVAGPQPEARLTSATEERAPAHGDALAERLSRYERGLVVLGPQSGIDVLEGLEFARRLGWPVLADALSGRRSHPGNPPNVLGAYDAYLRDDGVCRELAPDLILRFGDPPTSKPLATYLQRHRDALQLLVAPTGRWPDPDLTADEIVYCDPAEACREMLPHLAERPCGDWLQAWLAAESAAIQTIDRLLNEEAMVSEASAVTDLAAVIPPGQTVFAGNSMPVRDIDSFWPADGRLISFRGNRGASGIDGVVSTALGVAAASEGGVTLVIGDLSFYHDMNGLLAARRFGLKATIVLINNDGGGIFSFLPQHADPQHFEALFGTPHGLDFSPVAQLYGVGFERVTTRAEYRAALQWSFAADGVQVIEVRTRREANLSLHQRIWDEVARALMQANRGAGTSASLET